MKKTVQIVTIPLNKEGWNINELVLDSIGLCLAEHDYYEGCPKWQPQQLLVLSDDEIQESDWVLSQQEDESFNEIYKWDGQSYLDKDYKIIASYPQIEGTLPISKETVQAWIDAGTPGEGSVEIDDTIYCSVVKGKVKYGDPTKLDPQGNLLLEFLEQQPEEDIYNGVVGYRRAGRFILKYSERYDDELLYPELVKKMTEYYKDVKIIQEKSSIPTDEEIEKNSKDYAYAMKGQLYTEKGQHPANTACHY
jgi:hypothetical protein